jgi:serine/threonine protein kinase
MFVLVGIDDNTRKKVAVKLIETKNLNEQPSLKRKVQQEIRALKKMQGHPNIVELHEVIINEKSINLVMEYCSDGDLYSLIVNR